MPALHEVQGSPPAPHAAPAVPGRHVEALQQPSQEVASHTQLPLTHRCPVAQLPLGHGRPQPSSAPHALPAQLGVQHGPLVAHTCPAAQQLPPQLPAVHWHAPATQVACAAQLPL
jgi:hypothetical protein